MTSRETFALDDYGIDGFSERLDELLDGAGTEPRNRIRVRLSLEEALLRMRDHFGDTAEVAMQLRTFLSSTQIRLEHVGPPFNPLSAEDEENSAWSSAMLFAGDLSPQYTYTGNSNLLTLTIRNATPNPLVSMVVGMALGIVVGMVAHEALGDTIQRVAGVVFDPLFDLWSSLLNVLAGPVIFLSTISTTLGTQGIERQGGSRELVIVRYFLLSFFVAFVAVTAADQVYALPFSWDELNRQTVYAVLEGIASLVPNNIIQAFETANTPQLLLLAFVIGNALVVLGDSVKYATRVVLQLNMAATLITNWASRLAPLFAGLLLALRIGEGHYDLLAQLWSPLLLSLALSLAFMALELVFLCVRFGVGLRATLRKLRAPFVAALRTGTLDASYGEAEHSCVHGLGINKAFANVTLPQGLVLYMPASIMGTLVFVLFSAGAYGVETTPLWMASAAILDVLLFVATPAVPGANLLAFIAIFMQLGIPQEAFVDAMIFDIVFGIFANAANQALLQAEMVRTANRLGLLDVDRLRK